MSLEQRDDEGVLSSGFYFFYNTEGEEGRAKLMSEESNDVEEESSCVKEFRIEWHSELNRVSLLQAQNPDFIIIGKEFYHSEISVRSYRRHS